MRINIRDNAKIDALNALVAGRAIISDAMDNRQRAIHATHPVTGWDDLGVGDDVLVADDAYQTLRAAHTAVDSACGHLNNEVTT